MPGNEITADDLLKAAKDKIRNKKKEKQMQEEIIRNCEECNNKSAHLMRCGRCRFAWFCNERCFRKNYEVHKHYCTVNEIADSIEASDPKLAEFMRKNNKNAIINSENIEETKDGRNIPYGKLPRPKWRFDEDEAMNPPDPDEEYQKYLDKIAKQPFVPLRESIYTRTVVVPDSTLGQSYQCYKWVQSVAFIHIAIRLPRRHISRTDVNFILTPRTINLSLNYEHLEGDASNSAYGQVICGQFPNIVKVEESTWYIHEEGILEIILIKLWRKGNLGPCKSLAETWWPCLLTHLPRLSVDTAPSSYFSTENIDLNVDINDYIGKSTSSNSSSKN